MPARPPAATSWDDIRLWEGRQSRAFEEICFQLRDPEPPGVELRKTDDPDAGFEWYWRYPDGTDVGWQCKFIPDEKALIGAMKASFTTVAKRRPHARKITFCISRDFADDPDEARGKFGWQRFDEACVEWAKEAPHIEVRLLQGGELLERLARPEHRGREWFWFGRPAVLDPEWCRAQWKLARESARERYRPDLNVELPIASTLAAIAAPDDLRARFERHVTTIIGRCRQVLAEAARSAAYSETATNLRDAAQELEADADVPWHPVHPLASGFSSRIDDLQTATQRLLEVTAAQATAATAEANPPEDTTPEQRLIAQQAELRGHQARAVERVAARLLSASYELEDLVAGPAISAARERMLLLEGGGGSGKTHLSCEVARQLIDAGHPVLLLLGQWFGAASPWPTLAERLGDPGLGWKDICGALEAAAQATGKRAVLLIDAVNEAVDARMWARHLAELRSRLTDSGWASIGLTCRTTYLPAIRPTGGFGDHVVCVTHPGFQGREFEAVEHFFAAFDLEEPRVPLLLPEFTNPLFLILYCEAQARGRLPPGGAAHLTAVFTAFVDGRKPDIESELDLDPTLDLVGRAVRALADRLAANGNDHLPYDEAKALVDAIAPGNVMWPDTLFGRMLSEGLLSRDYAYFGPDDHGEAVRFPYQRFSDHLIVDAMLDEHLDSGAVRASFAPSQPLEQLALGGRMGLLEALAIQLPERCGVELPTVIEDDAGDESRRVFWRRRRVLDAFVSSVAARDPSVAGKDIVDLLNEALRHRLEGEVTGAIVAVAAIPDHPLNARWLHDLLQSRAMPDRDASWSRLTYYAYGTTGDPLDRLVRWASRGPYPAYPAEVVHLAATPLIWLLASPNRFARDQTTKALVALLRDRLDILAGLVRQFAAVDDAYVTERLAAVAYACLLRSDPAQVDKGQTVDLLRALVTALEGALPNVLMRDHVAGCARWARRHLGLTEASLIAAAMPPYGSKAPKMPRREAWLEERYPRGTTQGEPGYSSVHSSVLSDFGDFGHYAVRPGVENFLARRLGDPEPPPPEPEPPEPDPQVDEKRWNEFLSTLNAAQTTSLESGDAEWVTTSLSEHQLELLRKTIVTPPPQRRRRPKVYKSDKYPVDRANRFIFQRCVELGWTPERFGAVDVEVGRDDPGRSAHKNERFGKKYQWIALFELLARLSDNHVLVDWHDERLLYEGAWQLSCRDIDPTLPVGQITIDSEDERNRAEPFRQDPVDAWWVTEGPQFDHATRESGEWAQRTDDLPDVLSMFVRTDLEGKRYVVLDGQLEYADNPRDDTSMNDPDDRPRRDLGVLLAMAFARRADLDSLLAWLEVQPDPLRSIPGWDDQPQGESYLGEMPWAPSAPDRQVDWHRQAFGRQAELPVDVIAPVVPWHQSGNGFDCSLDETVNIGVPSAYLHELGGLRWDGDTLAWLADGEPVLFYHETDEGWHRDWIVLADEQWILDLLARHQLVLLCAGFAERRMFRLGGSEPMGWIDIGAGAVLADGTWTIRDWQVIWDHRGGKDPM